MKIGWIGSRGIPVKYGGSEVFTEEISKKLTEMGFKIYVTCESKRFYQDEYNGVIRLHTPSIEDKTITVPSINDVIATLYLLLKCPDIKFIYYMNPDAALGAAISKIFRKKVIFNTDGIEWKRPALRRKYFSVVWKVVSFIATGYEKWMEWMAVRLSDVVIADSRAIKIYLEQKYKARNVVYIPPGARELINSDIPAEREQEILKDFGLSTGQYYLTVSRIVAENNIHREIEGFKRSKSDKKLVIIGNFNEKDRYNKYLLKLRDGDPKIAFLDAIYDKEMLGVLRKNCYAYIHAYQVGGTNPSLLEQMLFQKPIIAYDVPFSREVLQGGGIYFRDEDGLASTIELLEKGEVDLKKIADWQAKRIEEEYNWDYVAKSYDTLFKRMAS
ncbi:MAG: DUF1972 domain-containing protein [Dehalococcoidia bacterium]